MSEETKVLKLPQRSVAIVWHAEDIEDRAKALGTPLSDAEVDAVLDAIGRQHDADIGISWDVIDTHISMTVADRKD